MRSPRAVALRGPPLAKLGFSGAHHVSRRQRGFALPLHAEQSTWRAPVFHDNAAIFPDRNRILGKEKSNPIVRHLQVVDTQGKFRGKDYIRRGKVNMDVVLEAQDHICIQSRVYGCIGTGLRTYCRTTLIRVVLEKSYPQAGRAHPKKNPSEEGLVNQSGSYAS